MVNLLKKILNFLGLKKSNNRSFILNIISQRNNIIQNKNLVRCEIGVYKGNFSIQILKYFQNKGFSLKLFLIDPWKIDSDYKFVLKDLNIWFSKLKSGEIIFGDDYLRPYGVYKAVNEFSFSKKISIGFSDCGNQYFFIKN